MAMECRRRMRWRLFGQSDGMVAKPVARALKVSWASVDDGGVPLPGSERASVVRQPSAPPQWVAAVRL